MNLCRAERRAFQEWSTANVEGVRVGRRPAEASLVKYVSEAVRAQDNRECWDCGELECGLRTDGCFDSFFFLINLFLAALGLCCCTRAFSGCSECGLLFAVRGLLIVVASLVVEHRLQARGLQQLWLAGSREQAQYLWHTGPVAPWHVGSSQPRARTRVPCVGRRILNHCATREVRCYYF